MSNNPNNRPNPGPTPVEGEVEAKGVDKLLSRFGPVRSNKGTQTPGPQPVGNDVARPAQEPHPAGQQTATIEQPSPLFDGPADTVFGGHSSQPAHLAGAVQVEDDLLIVPDQFDEPPVEVIDRRDWVRMPRRTGPVLRFLLIGFGVVFVVGTAFSQVNNWLSNQFDPPGDPGAAVEFEIAQGATSNEVTQQLFAQDVIANPTLFRYWVGDNIDGDFLAGQYNCLQENMSFEEARDCLVDEGPVPPTFFSVTIPEGLRLTEIVDVLNAENPSFELAGLRADLAATIVSVNLDGVPELPIDGNPDPTGSGKEGLLFPATYQIDERDQGNTRAILARMADQLDIEFERAEAEVGRAPVVDQLELTDYEVLIVASLIEEEYGVEQDLRRISRVIYNRLLAESSLGIDATACYAASKACADLTREDLDSESPWNTRNVNNVGLPPTPIASPGAAAIRAALNPEPGEWFWYVLTDESGAHTFANTEGEFNAAVSVCRERGLGC